MLRSEIFWAVAVTWSAVVQAWLVELISGAKEWDIVWAMAAIAGAFFGIMGGVFGIGWRLGRFFDKSGAALKYEIKDLTTQLDAATHKGEVAKAEAVDATGQLTKLNELRAALESDEDDSLWQLRGLAEAPQAIRDYLSAKSTKIVTVMNLKGGVGKTTTVANLAAYFSAQGKKVLAIDMDYQGSLSRMMLLGALGGTREGEGPRVAEFLSGNPDVAGLRRQVVSLAPALANVDLVTANITLDKIENRLLVQWLIGDIEDDIRYRLASVLTSEPFHGYDIILIDAPPRMSTGAVNALACSQYLLMPTVLDELSAQGIGVMVDRLTQVRQMNMRLEYVGVIGTLRGQLGGADVQARAREVAQEQVANWAGVSYLFENDIQYFTSLARQAGTNVGYLQDKSVKAAYDFLGQELSRELRL
ncbi:MAG: AAA family ATPase [Pseudomonadota bacterium]